MSGEGLSKYLREWKKLDKQLSVGKASQAEETAKGKTPWQSGLECSCDSKEARGWNRVNQG